MTAADNLAITARAGKAFTFLKNGSTEFFPGAGSTLHFANRDTDTFTARNIPAGLLQAGDSVTVKYGNTVVFKGDVDRIVDRHGRGDDRVQDVTVAGPWGKLNRLVFKQTWGAGAVAFSSSRVILGQTAAGLAQTMAAQLAEIAGFAATPCGIALGANNAPNTYLPLDEARDVTCADAIRRELRFFPKLVVRFDYSQATPSLQIVDTEHADSASYMATIPKTDREYVYSAHPVSCVDVTVDAVEISANGDRASFHQVYPADGDTDDLDCLHVTVPLARGGGSTTSETFKIETEDVPSDLDDKAWWKAKHPRLANVASSAITISYGARSDSGESTVYPRILKNAKDEVEAAGKHCRVTRFTCKCKISTADDDEEDIDLTMDFLTTDATTGAYTVQTGSTAAAGETLPTGLAQALYEQRSQSLVSEAVTVRLGASFPKLGDKLVETVGNASETLFLQSFDVDVADLTARLAFGQPEHLSAEDMKSLLNGFRQRGSAYTAKLREDAAAEDDDDADAPGGIPPIASSEWSPGTKQKTTIKGGAGAGNIVLDASTVDDGKSIETAKLKYTDAEGNEKEAQILGTEDVEIPNASGGVKSLNDAAGDMDVIGGESIRVETDGQTIRISYDGGKEPDEDPNAGDPCAHPGSNGDGGVPADNTDAHGFGPGVGDGGGGVPADDNHGMSAGTPCNCD